MAYIGSSIKVHMMPNEALGAIVCMSRRDMPVYLGDVTICWRSCAEPGSGLFGVHFLPHDVTFSILVVASPPLRRNLTLVNVKIARPKCTQTLTVMNFCWSRDTVLFCAKTWYLQTHIYAFTTSSVASRAIGNFRQAKGDIRHLVPNVSIGLGRDIRDMPIACARTHPDTDKHTRHIST